MKFEVPESYIKQFGTYKPMSGASAAGAKQAIKSEMIQPGVKYPVVAFRDGLPKEFLTKVYRGWDDFKSATVKKNWDDMNIQEKIKAISEDPERSKNFLKKADETIQENIRRSKRGTKGD